MSQGPAVLRKEEKMPLSCRSAHDKGQECPRHRPDHSRTQSMGVQRGRRWACQFLLRPSPGQGHHATPSTPCFGACVSRSCPGRAGEGGCRLSLGGKGVGTRVRWPWTAPPRSCSRTQGSVLLGSRQAPAQEPRREPSLPVGGGRLRCVLLTQRTGRWVSAQHVGCSPHVGLVLAATPGTPARPSPLCTRPEVRPPAHSTGELAVSVHRQERLRLPSPTTMRGDRGGGSCPPPRDGAPWAWGLTWGPGRSVRKRTPGRKNVSARTVSKRCRSGDAFLLSGPGAWLLHLLAPRMMHSARGWGCPIRGQLSPRHP